jgi:MFS family permease
MQLGGAAVMRNPPTFQAVSKAVPWGQIVRTPQLWNLFSHFALNQFAMTFIATSFKVYGETLDFADDAFLTFVGSVGASFNFFSRPFFGRLADYSHRIASIGCSLLGAFLLVTWTFAADQGKFWFTLWVCGLYFSGGGNYGMFPVSNAKIFDTSQAGAAYGIVFCGTIVGNVIGALVMKSMVASYGWGVVTVVFGLLVGCGSAVGFLFELPGKPDTLLGTELGARSVRR